MSTSYYRNDKQRDDLLRQIENSRWHMAPNEGTLLTGNRVSDDILDVWGREDAEKRLRDMFGMDQRQMAASCAKLTRIERRDALDVLAAKLRAGRMNETDAFIQAGRMAQALRTMEQRDNGQPPSGNLLRPVSNQAGPGNSPAMDARNTQASLSQDEKDFAVNDQKMKEKYPEWQGYAGNKPWYKPVDPIKTGAAVDNARGGQVRQKALNTAAEALGPGAVSPKHGPAHISDQEKIILADEAAKLTPDQYKAAFAHWQKGHPEGGRPTLEELLWASEQVENPHLAQAIKDNSSHSLLGGSEDAVAPSLFLAARRAKNGGQAQYMERAADNLEHDKWRVGDNLRTGTMSIREAQVRMDQNSGLEEKYDRILEPQQWGSDGQRQFVGTAVELAKDKAMGMAQDKLLKETTRAMRREVAKYASRGVPKDLVNFAGVGLNAAQKAVDLKFEYENAKNTSMYRLVDTLPRDGSAGADQELRPLLDAGSGIPARMEFFANRAGYGVDGVGKAVLELSDKAFGNKPGQDASDISEEATRGNPELHKIVKRHFNPPPKTQAQLEQAGTAMMAEIMANKEYRQAWVPALDNALGWTGFTSEFGPKDKDWRQAMWEEHSPQGEELDKFIKGAQDPNRQHVWKRLNENIGNPEELKELQKEYMKPSIAGQPRRTVWNWIRDLPRNWNENTPDREYPKELWKQHEVSPAKKQNEKNKGRSS